MKHGAVVLSCWGQTSEDVIQDGEGDWQVRLCGEDSMVTLDPTDDALNKWGLGGFKWQIAFDMQGPEVGEIGFDGLGFNPQTEG